jgi:hypothetical protein
VQIKVDYDGPSLSDTSSMASMEEYKGRNGSQLSFSVGASPALDLDDDSVTVSSRDAGGTYLSDEPPTLNMLDRSRKREGHSEPSQDQVANQTSSDTHLEARVSPSWVRPTVLTDVGGTQPLSDDAIVLHKGDDPFSDEYRISANSRYPEDPSAVFERLKLEEDGISFFEPSPLTGDDRGVAWLRDQNDRVIRSMLGALPEPSESGASVALENGGRSDRMGGDLSLRRDPRGKYYYSYTSAGSSSASQIHDSSYEDGPSVNGDVSMNRFSSTVKPRLTSMNLNWLAAQRVPTIGKPSPNNSLSNPSHSRPILHFFNSELLPAPKNHWTPDYEIPREMQIPQFPGGPPRDQLTDCSECGVLLDSIRYVCSTCGEKTPLEKRSDHVGKGRPTSFESRSMTYPPTSHRTTAPSPRETSRAYLMESDYPFGNGSSYCQKPLPSLPSPSNSQSTLMVSNSLSRSDWQAGYELCSGCIESAGVNHAIEVGLSPDSVPGRGDSSPSSPEETRLALSQWRRSAPKQKGHLRHGYLEKVWGHLDWEDVGKYHLSCMIVLVAVTNYGFPSNISSGRVSYMHMFCV